MFPVQNYYLDFSVIYSGNAYGILPENTILPHEKITPPKCFRRQEGAAIRKVVQMTRKEKRNGLKKGNGRRNTPRDLEIAGTLN